jgi:hypothetical protein
LLGGLLIGPAAATSLTTDEIECEQALSRGLGQFAVDLAKCITRCEAGARNGDNPASDCLRPYAGATAACIRDARTGAEVRAAAGVARNVRDVMPELLLGRRLPLRGDDASRQHRNLGRPIRGTSPEGTAGERPRTGCSVSFGRNGLL